MNFNRKCEFSPYFIGQIQVRVMIKVGTLEQLLPYKFYEQYISQIQTPTEKTNKKHKLKKGGESTLVFTTILIKVSTRPSSSTLEHHKIRHAIISSD